MYKILTVTKKTYYMYFNHAMSVSAISHLYFVEKFSNILPIYV